MATPPVDPARNNPSIPKRGKRDGYPSDEELLHELRLHGAKPRPAPPVPTISRRTRDYLLITSVGSISIGIGVFRVLGDGDSGNALKLALTGIAVFCGLLWFVFYGVMSRY